MRECMVYGTVARDAKKTNKQLLSNLSFNPGLWYTSWRLISFEMFVFLSWQKVSASQALAWCCPTASGAVHWMWSWAGWERCGAERVTCLCETPDLVSSQQHNSVLYKCLRFMGYPFLLKHIWGWTLVFHSYWLVWLMYSSNPHPSVWVIL